MAKQDLERTPRPALAASPLRLSEYQVAQVVVEPAWLTFDRSEDLGTLLGRQRDDLRSEHARHGELFASAGGTTPRS